MGDTVQTTAGATLRPWPHSSSIAHLVLRDVSMIPTPTQVDGWVDDAFDGPIDTIRTGALFPAAADAFAEQGFEPVDRLALLERSLDPSIRLGRRSSRSDDVRLRRIRAGELDTAASLDAASFPDGWRNDAQSLADIERATPSGRSRFATIDRRPVGFAITGRAGDVGYLQRFAVEPSARRRGVAGRLVDDAVRWLARRGATRALVNTGVGNTAGIALYESHGFERRADELVVMELGR